MLMLTPILMTKELLLLLGAGAALGGFTKVSSSVASPGCSTAAATSASVTVSACASASVAGGGAASAGAAAASGFSLPLSVAGATGASALSASGTTSAGWSPAGAGVTLPPMTATHSSMVAMPSALHCARKAASALALAASSLPELADT